MNILLIGSGAREHALARAIKRSPQNVNLFCFASNNNPGIKELSKSFVVGDIKNPSEILDFAQKNNIDFSIIGPESPLEAGVADKLWKNNIGCVGPKQNHAQLETSKSFTRDLLKKYEVAGGPNYRKFESIDGVEEFLNKLEGNYVIKADGLMGGKGVKVSGEHLKNIEEGIKYSEELLKAGSKFVVEEKFIGEEFSLMSFCDGKNLAHMPPIQDHKRAFNGDTGPNTGGMGSYSDSNHLLPFLTPEDVRQAYEINKATAVALLEEFGEGYKGILYGGFMVTKNGVKLIEYNARLGDPEAMNVLAILESDFVALCEAIIKGNLSQNHAKFKNLATVCKYVVPDGYPDDPVKNQEIDISQISNPDQLYLASVEEKDGKLYELSSRAVAVVGIDSDLYKAEAKAEEEVLKITGPVYHRSDIGTKELIEKKVEHLKNVRINR